MKFRRLQIDGFGIWHNLALDLEPGLTVFVAPNEGGKTTLMGFFRAVLFGFRRRDDPQRYEPLRGGKHGGWLEVEQDGEVYRLVRTEDGSSAGGIRVLGDDGSRLADTKLKSLLRSTSEELYENVFAFGLSELQIIDTLQGDEVAGHIYSAGMTGGKTDPIAFRQGLRAQMDDLYRPRGRNQAIPRLLDDLRELQQEIQELQQLPEEHAALLEDRQELRARLVEVDETLEKYQEELDAGRRAQRAWRDYEDLLSAESSLEALGVSLERARGKEEPEGERAGVAEAIDILSHEQRTLLAEAGHIRSLLATAPRLRELQASVQKHAQDAGVAAASLDSHLGDLGEGWDVPRILSVETGLEVREAARQHGEEIREARAEIESIAARAADAHDTYEAVVARTPPVSREAVMLTWGVAGALTLLAAVTVPETARLVATATVGATGAVTGLVMLWLRRRGRQQLAEERLAAADRETTLWAQHELAEKQLEEVRAGWRAWLRKRGFPEDLTVDGALDLVDRVREAQEVARQKRAAEEARARAREELVVACGRVNALLEKLDRSPVETGDDAAESVEPLLGRLESLQSELESAEDHRVRLRTVLDQYAQARAALRAIAGDEGAESLRERLESLDPDRLERQVETAERAVSAAKAQRDGINEQLGSVTERISHLEGDTELAELLLEREQKRTELMEAVEDWAGYATAVALFDQAKQVYEEQRQPDVLRRASRFFSEMTRGRYARVVAPLGETRLEVEERKGGKRKRPEVLSRGTREQLYLAMRLALASVYGDEALSLPLVADDILVNFDDERAAATAALLGSYAREESQVLAFTCHTRLAEVFADEAPDAALVELPAPD